ncbi:Hypothetical predicted protein [Paramuricea clavata]|uniref:Uncharacterized protein n=1 Tax=Paramuricea clavata TaxID=317549 RepID=A0A6S7J1C9_PARCT|nr:Hypothetical predicted protein [Paramuricea clavata]
MANREPKKRKRGRPIHKLSVMPFLLDPDNVVKKVTKEICSKEAIIRLMQNGYGPPQPDHCTNTEKGKVEFSFQLTNEEFKQKLYEIYPKLENGCFVFMKAGKHNTLEELGAGSCCYRCYTPENVYHSNPGQGRLYIRRIAENEISSSCNHGMSRFKRLCGMVAGSPQLYIPILPKPVLAVPPSNSVVAESENVVTSTAMPTNSQLSASGNLRMELRPLLCNTPPLDLSSSSIVVAHTKSTLPVQNSGNMVTQKPLPSSTSTFVNESRCPVSVSGISTTQGPSPEFAIDSGTETRPSFYISGNMVTQNQLPLSAIVPQTASTPAVHSSGTIVTQNQLSLSTIVSQAASSKPVQSSVNVVPQSQLPLSTIDPQTASTPAVHSSGNMVTQSYLPLSTIVSQTASGTPVNGFASIVPQSQLPLSTVVSQNALAPSLQSSVSAVTQSQLPMLDTVSQTASSQPFHSYVNMVPQGQVAISTILSETALRPPVNSSGNTALHSQLPLTIYSVDDCWLPVNNSVNAATQNRLPIATSSVAGNTSMSAVLQSSDNMVGQSQLQTFASGTATRQGQFSRSVGVSDRYLEQPMFSTSSQIAAVQVEQGPRAILQARGVPPITDTNRSLVIIGNTNMLEATDIGSQMTNEVMSGFRDPNMQVSNSNVTPPLNPSVSDRWVQSPGLATLADVIEIVQREPREEAITSMANSLNVQVCLYIYFYLLSFKEKLA